MSRWTGRKALPERLQHDIVEKASGTPEADRAAPRKIGLDEVHSAALGRCSSRRAFLLGAAALLYPRLGARSARIEPKVAVGQFQLASADLPQALPNMVGQEIVAAFGAENAVAVISPGDRNVAKSPFLMDGSISKVGPAVRFINLKNQRTGVVLGPTLTNMKPLMRWRLVKPLWAPLRSYAAAYGCLVLQGTHVRIRHFRCTSNGATSIGAVQQVKRPNWMRPDE